MTKSASRKGEQSADAIYALGFHSTFTCRQSGMCCRPGYWGIRVEAAERDRIVAALEDGRLTYPPGMNEPEQIFKRDNPTDRHVFFQEGEGGFCVLLDQERGGCRIHSQQGVEMLPGICRTYPRKSTRTEAGTFVSLACSCHGAVAMLFEDSGPFEVVSDPPLGSEMLPTQVIVGMPPPKLTPEMRLPLGAYHQWEARCVEILSRDDLTPELSLLTIASMLEQGRVRQGGKEANSPFMKALLVVGNHPDALSMLREKIPLDRRLVIQHMRAILGFGVFSNGAIRGVMELLMSRYGGDEAAAVERFKEDDLQFVAGSWETFSLPLRRYIASRVFNNRLAWATDGMRSTLFAVIMMLASVRVLSAVLCGQKEKPLDREVLEEAIRATDLLFNHSEGEIKQGGLNYFDRAEYMDPTDYLTPLRL
ncbi:MAG: YkgJ family cysteine cluster protein [Leptospirillia bacterium]